MRLPIADHYARPWRIHEIAPDFRVEDVWAIPTRGGANDFLRLIDVALSFDPSHSTSLPVRVLFAARWKLGELFGWDKPSSGIGSRVASLRDRLPADLRDLSALRPHGKSDALPFTPLYVTSNEFAGEIANETVHGVLHLGWVSDNVGGYRGQMAVLVKPHGVLGQLYMAAIKPFRYTLVYPTLLREFARAWAEGEDSIRP